MKLGLFARVVGGGLVLAASASAQGTGVMLPVPPLAPIGLPLPHIGLPTPEEQKATKPVKDADTPPARPHRRQPPAPIVIYAPVIVGATAAKTPGPAASRTEPTVKRASRTGTLELDVQGEVPYSVFVDGLYVGTSEQVGGSLTLESGTHDIDLQPEWQPARRFRVRIAAGKATRYEAALDTSDTAPGLAAAAPVDVPMEGARTLYVIAGCYAGNVPPVQAALPAGCDARHVTLLRR